HRHGPLLARKPRHDNLSRGIPAKPIRHIRDRQRVTAVLLHVPRAGDGLRPLTLTTSRLPEPEERNVGDHRQQVHRDTPCRVVLGIHRLIQLRIPAQTTANNPQITPVEPRRRAIPQPESKADQIKLKRLPMVPNKGQEAEDSPTLVADSSSHRWIISASSRFRSGSITSSKSSPSRSSISAK